MIEIYERIINFSKLYPVLFWGGISFLVLIISVLVIRFIKSKKTKDPFDSEINKVVKENLKYKKEKSPDQKVGRKVDLTYKNETNNKEQLKVSKATYKPPQSKNKIVEEPKIKYDSLQSNNQSKAEVKRTKSSPKEKLPKAKKEEVTATTRNLFVNYKLALSESTENYAVLRIPQKGCIIRSHRYGNTKRRGFKELVFQTELEKYFERYFEVSGKVRLNTGKETRPFEPDIALIEKGNDNNIRIDIEIDEPYAGLTRQPTHCMGDDLMRDTYFVDRGWIVIRFSEYQVHTQELSCLKFLSQIINKIDSRYEIPVDLKTVPDLKPEKLWDIVQAQKWEKAKHRETYLNHEFREIKEEKETIERDFNSQEIDEEKLVKSSLIGTVDNGSNIGFNKSNKHRRDKRIAFYPENHIYTIDNIPVPSASTIISKFFPEFDAYGKASTLSPNNPLYGLPVEEIVQTWRQRGIDAANLGTHLHEQIEKYYLEQPYEETEEFNLFKDFVKEHPDIKPYRSEWKIFDDKYNIAGTIDLICKNGNGYEIYDWKRSKKVVDTYSGKPITFDKWGNCGVGSLSDIDDTSYNKYCLQQSLYRYILENNYNINISKMYLVVLYPDYDKYYKVETPYWKERIEYILETTKC